MTPRPCTWPDGGCGEPIIAVTTAAGRKQVLDAKPQKRIVLLWVPDAGEERARVVDTYTDHHATCATWLARVERERAAKAGRP
jgi:hypothetical protein